MGTGASIKENISFDQLEVTETLHDFLEDEKSKSHEANHYKVVRFLIHNVPRN